MLRIGIVGSDNSHAVTFAKLANLDGPERVAGCRVVSLFGLEEARNREVAEKGAIPTIVDRPEAMIGEVDLVFVVFRHGDLHAEYALPFLQAGIPTFVDKPFAIAPDDCRRMWAAAQKHGAPLTSFSVARHALDVQAFKARLREHEALTAGSIGGPAQQQSPYGGLFFYGIHEVEMMQEVFGTGARSVYASAQGDNVVATVRFDGNLIVSLHLNGAGKPAWHITAYSTAGVDAIAPLTKTGYRESLLRLIAMAEQRTAPLTFTQLTEPIAVLNAIVTSLEHGREVAVQPIAAL